MISNDPMKEELLKAVEKLPHNVYEFTKLASPQIDLLSLKAAFIICNNDEIKIERWIPFSQLKRDRNNDIWISNWLLNKIMEDEKN